MKNVIKIIFLLLLCQPEIYADTDYIEQGKAHFKSGFYHLTPKQHLSEAKLQYVQAIKEFKQAIEVDPNNETAYRYLARIYAIQQRPAEAAEAYQKVITLNPWDVDTYVLAALALFESKQYDSAVKTLQVAKEYTGDKVIHLKIDSYISKIELHGSAKEVLNAK